MEETRFKRDAKAVVDTLFDIKVFKEDVTRDDMLKLEDLVSFMLQSNFESYVKSKDILERLKK